MKRAQQLLEDAYLAELFNTKREWERSVSRQQELRAYYVVCGILTAVILLVWGITR